jgi:hypothetical protein
MYETGAKVRGILSLFQELSRILVGVVATRGVIYDRVRKEGLEYDVKCIKKGSAEPQ